MGFMKEIHVDRITECVEKLCIDANYYLNPDIYNSMKTFLNAENSENGKTVLDILIKNADIARNEGIAICQDTGMAVVFLEVGQDVHIVGGNLYDAVNEGVRRGYRKGYLRASVVKHPLKRVNTGDNTPAVIYTEIVDGDKIRIDVAPKGFGSENMSAVKMLKPSDGIDGVRDFVIKR